MKKLLGFIAILMLLVSIVSCKKEVDDEPLDLSYGFLLGNVWEKYLIESFFNDTFDIENVDEFLVFGYYQYHYGVGDDDAARFYLGDEKTSYALDFLITYDENSDIEFQHFSFTYNDSRRYGVQNIYTNYSLEADQSLNTLDEYIESIKSDLIDKKQRNDDIFLPLQTDETVYEFEYIEDRYQVEEIKHYLPVILDIKLSNSIYYMITETEASVIGYYYDGDFESYVIASEIDAIPVQKIYEGAFRYAKIDTLSIPSSIKEFGYESFAESRFLNLQLEQDSQLRLIKKLAFDRAYVRGFIIPISVSIIERDAFKDFVRLSRLKAEATEKPNGWNEFWISDNSIVEWGYTQEVSD